ncbi:hypothetical protein NKH18_22125 [Streptomyces sp. M10(2022)]
MSVVWASAEHRDAGEVAANLVDASAGKWFAGHNRASLEFELAQPVAVDRYVLTSADDAPDRDPAAWTLRGSADGHLWRTLDIRSGQSFAERHRSRTYRIAEPGATAIIGSTSRAVTAPHTCNSKPSGSWPTRAPVSSATAGVRARTRSPTRAHALGRRRRM